MTALWQNLTDLQKNLAKIVFFFGEDYSTSKSFSDLEAEIEIDSAAITPGTLETPRSK